MNVDVMPPPHDWPPLTLPADNDATRAFVVAWGRECGIPECCIAEFTEDICAGRLPFRLRSSFSNAGGVYVPCTKCLRREQA